MTSHDPVFNKHDSQFFLENMETDVPVEIPKKPKRKIGFTTLSNQPKIIPQSDTNNSNTSLHHFNNTDAGKAWAYVQTITYENYKSSNKKLAKSLDVLHDFIRKFSRTEKLLLIANHVITKTENVTNNNNSVKNLTNPEIDTKTPFSTFFCNGWKTQTTQKHPLIFPSIEFDQICSTCDLNFYEHIKRYDRISSSELDILVSAALDAHILKHAVPESNVASVKQALFAVYELIRNALSTDCGQRAQSLKLTGMPPFESPTLETIVRHG